MRRTMLITVLVVIALMSAMSTVQARELERKVPMLDEPSIKPASLGPTGAAGSIVNVNAQSADTFYYGGTDIIGGLPRAAEPAVPGWANRKMWSFGAGGFNGTPHSGLFMDGWAGVDNTAQAENYFYVADDATLGATCVISGNKSLFCGATNAQCIALCFVDQNGTGYGNGYKQTVVTPNYTYAAGDQITLTYKYNNESESGYDFTDVILQIWDTVALEWVNYDTLAQYTDLVSGTEVVDVDSYMAALTPPIDFRIEYTFAADGGYSDEDGYFPTDCGGLLIDDYSLAWAGGPTHSENFEGVAVGGLPLNWQKLTLGCGDYAHTRHIGDLPIGLDQDPCLAQLGSQWCQIADSVLVLSDENTPGYPHPLCQDNYVVSPAVDFSGHPGMPGRLIHWERFGRLPQTEYIFMYWQVRYKPSCESGGWSSWVHDNYVYYTPEGTSCRAMEFDVSYLVAPGAQQAQIGLGVINYCDEDPWGRHDCTYTCNVTPYYDNVTFGVYGSDVAPYVGMRELDYWQDQFAEDGTNNPHSTVDTRVAGYLSNLVPPIFGDTLTCRGVADNMEVYFVFRMARVGPYQVTTHPFFTTWFPGVTAGGWKEARMDTAEVTSVSGTSTEPVKGQWMCAFHEDDPIRVANALPECKEILTNNIFVPGTRIEYFLKARYSNSADLFFLPDTTGARYEEFEVLPTPWTHGSTDGWCGNYEVSYWQPCVLVVDHFGQRGNWSERNSDRIIRHLRALNVPFDIFHKLGPASDQRNGIGRWPPNPGQSGGPGTDKYNWGPGATLEQFRYYKKCLLNAGDILNYSMSQYDVDMIDHWLNIYSYSLSFKFFWLSGDQVLRWLYNQVPWGRSLLRNTLGVTYVNRNYAAFTGDYTYCLPVNFAAGGRLTGCSGQYVARMNGCSRTFTVLDVYGSVDSARAERMYDSQPTPGIASISNSVYVTGGANYKTLSEGYDNCLIRTDASLGPLACGEDDFLTQWMACVLDWASYPESYGGAGVSVPPAMVTSLGRAFPNPMNPTARINYTVGTHGRVWLRIYDVSGRVIRTLVDEIKQARLKPYEVMWNGTNDRGETVSSGVFFYQLEAAGYSSAKKIVILR